MCGVAVVLLFLALSAVAFFARHFHTDSWVLLLAASVCVLLWLGNYSNSAETVFFRFAVATVYCLFVMYCLHVNRALLEKWKPGKKTLIGVAIAAGVLSCAMIAGITCLRYLTFSSPNYDFGLFCNMFYNMAESGLPMVTSERDMLLSHFAVHISPVYYLLLPFFSFLHLKS